MATITLKNVPDDLYDQLKRSAERNRRSINREAIVCLEQALESATPDAEEVLARVRHVREKAAHLYVTEAELREARDEGRP